ncbi:MAG: nickel pincer cofactor biosynthesis protein LarC [Verrucomicrobiota bacterium]
MSTLLYQCPAGISGDMNLAAMVALGVNPTELETELRKLPYKGWALQFESDKRQGISGLRCDVVLTDDHTHSHSHGDEHHHHHGAHPHSHSHRHFAEIREAIDQSTLSSRVKADAIACFRVLAEAEGAVHGISSEEVHFHEVGAIDSIIDMVGAAVCWDLLGIDRVLCGTLEVGGGTVQCAHGRMPVPAPATARLLEGKPFNFGATNKETTTPTGAALLVGKRAEFGASASGQQIKTAIGIGQRDDPNLANALYVSLIDETMAATGYEPDQVVELVTNIDDMTAEDSSYLCEQLLARGAVEVWQTPATFKKGRLGTVIHALTTEADFSAVEAAFFKHSTTIGLRYQKWQRSKLKRTLSTVQTKWGPVGIKEVSNPTGETRFKFEHDDLARIATESNQSIDWVRTELEKLHLEKA